MFSATSEERVWMEVTREEMRNHENNQRAYRDENNVRMLFACFFLSIINQLV